LTAAADNPLPLSVRNPWRNFWSSAASCFPSLQTLGAAALFAGGTAFFQEHP
jgi:hypothetical protein